MDPLTVIDLFCGAGLFSAGFQRAGHRIIMGVDNDPIAIKSYRDNFPAAIAWEIDITKIDFLPKCDILIGGPPCQEYSKAQRTPRPQSSRGYPLIDKFLELVKVSGAEYWIMENVPGVKDYIDGKT